MITQQFVLTYFVNAYEEE